MKAKLTLAIIASLIGSGVRVHASEILPERTWWLQMYDSSAGKTLEKGSDLAKDKDFGKAQQYYDAAISRAPKEWPPYLWRAFVFQSQGKWALAAQDLNTVLRLKRTLYLAAILRGWMNERLGNYKSSLADYDKVLTLQPLPYTRALTLNSRAWLRATCSDTGLRNAQQAIKDAKAACNLTSWDKPDHIDTLAAAYAEAGDFDSAVRFEQRALAHERDEENRKGYEYRLAMYQAHHPFHYASK